MNKHVYNLKRDTEDVRDWLFKNSFKMVVQLPKSVDLRNKMPPIYNQENIGSCQSCAIDGIVSYIHNNPFEPSHLYTYYNTRVIEDTVNEDSGGTLRGTIKSCINNGITDGKYWEYDTSKFTIKPPQIAYDSATNNISSYYRIRTVDEAKQALAQGHCPYIGIVVYESMQSESCINTGKIPMPKIDERELGGHALDIVGYEDYDILKEIKPIKINIFTLLFNLLFCKNKETSTINSGKFLIRNSWGNCGINKTGYFEISYETFEKLLMDAWVIVK